ncbi:hypothetical protein O3U67_09850 [Brevundimonas diminuta]|uniref:hypothetical protein n=1 Tax=Brevundimonas diminuta TaxID=293 RepID=UPI0022AFA69B|nr:hypothetical protein [Brevundimonas diminuta]MCZ4108382.1 hypothetical protein [Brevundimonas diminuta]
MSEPKTKPADAADAGHAGAAGPARDQHACLYIQRLDQADMGVLRDLCVASWDEMKRRYP